MLYLSSLLLPLLLVSTMRDNWKIDKILALKRSLVFAAFEGKRLLLILFFFQILLEMDSLIIGSSSSSSSCLNGTDPFRSVDASSSLAQQEELDLIASTGRLKRLEAGYERKRKVLSQKNVIFEGKFDF